MRRPALALALALATTFTTTCFAQYYPPPPPGGMAPAAPRAQAPYPSPPMSQGAPTDSTTIYRCKEGERTVNSDRPCGNVLEQRAMQRPPADYGAIMERERYRQQYEQMRQEQRADEAMNRARAETARRRAWEEDQVRIDRCRYLRSELARAEGVRRYGYGSNVNELRMEWQTSGCARGY